MATKAKVAVNDGGPAFARGGCDWTEDHGDGAFANDGMSLRDYFAGQALMGILANSDLPDLFRTGFAPAKAAEIAYEVAKGMIAARDKR